MSSVQNGLTLEEQRAQLSRVVESGALQNAPMLQKLLEFVAQKAFDCSTEDLGESAIATKVFGRSADFDPTADTTVRTSVYRLRMKLREYYAQQGKTDPILIEIPKGHYVPVFTRREVEAPAPAPEPAPVLVHEPPKPRPPWLTIAVAAGLTMLVVGAILLAGWWRTTALANSGSRFRTGGVLASFWHGFAGDDGDVIIAYSNTELLQLDTRDLLRFDTGAIDDRGTEVERSVAEKSIAIPQLLRNHSVFYEDGYTGIGELQAVSAITQLLAGAKVSLVVKRARLLTTDDLKHHSIILLGSNMENRAIDELRLKQGYGFEFPSRGMWAGRILDRRPDRGAAGDFYAVERDPKGGALRSDYAVFSVMPGLGPNRKVMLLAGLTTSGTQGAAEFATAEPQLSALGNMLNAGGRKAGEPLPPYFETILQVQVVRGLDPVSVRCLKARPISN